MKQRIITGFFIATAYVGTIIGTIMWNPIIMDLFIVFLMMAAGMEMCNCLENKINKTVKPLFVVFAALLYIAYKAVMHYADVFYAVGAALLVTVLFSAIIVCYTMFSKKYEVSGGAGTALAMFYPAVMLIVFLSLAYLPEKFSSGAIIIAFLSTSLADTMAYFVGSTLKGPKFCPQISPKKTISGAIGGVIGGLISGLALFAAGRFSFVGISVLSSTIWVDLLNWSLIGIGSAIFCEIGDLIASYIKRACEIKDFGNVLLGHGGFMDRIDGLILSSVYIFIYYAVLSFVF